MSQLHIKQGPVAVCSASGLSGRRQDAAPLALLGARASPVAPERAPAAACRHSFSCASCSHCGNVGWDIPTWRASTEALTAPGPTIRFTICAFESV